MNKVLWVLRYAIGIRMKLWVAMALGLLSVFVSLTFSITQKVLIDDVFFNGRKDLLIPVMLSLLLAGVLKPLAKMGFNLVLLRGEAIVKLRLHEELGKHLTQMTVEQYREVRVGTLVNYFTNDLTRVSSLISGIMPRSITQLANLLMLTALIAYINVWILLLVTLFSAGYICLLHIYAPKMMSSSGVVHESRDKLMVELEESVSATKEIVAFDREDWDKRRINQRVQAYFGRVLNHTKLKNQQSIWSSPLAWGIQLIVLGFGGYDVLQGGMTIGYFVVIFQLTSQLMEGYQSLYQEILRLADHLASSERLRALLRRSSDIQGNGQLEGSLESIQLRKVKFTYSSASKPVLNGISLDIPQGTKLAIVGPSGGGKSTIAELLVRFYEPDKGVIYVNNMPLSSYARDSWAKKASIVFQDPYLFPDTIRNNLRMGRSWITDDQLIDACYAAHIHTYIETLPDGYDTEIGERGATLSGGQKQRLALARALAGNPELLILDEATSALDMETERRVMDNLGSRLRNTTVVTIAHRLSTIRDADIIVVLDEGQIKCQGRHDNLMEHCPLYRDLVLADDVQVEI